MRKTINKKINSNSTLFKNVIGISISNLISLILLVFSTCLFSLILLKSEKTTDNYIMYFYFCSGLSSFIGGFFASKKCLFKGLISGAVSSVSLSFIITIILLVVSNGQLRQDTGILYLIIVLFSVIGGIAGANTKSRK